MCEKRIDRSDNVDHLPSGCRGGMKLRLNGSHNLLYACLTIILGNMFVQLTCNGVRLNQVLILTARSHGGIRPIKQKITPDCP